jgi:hypothetical protein
MLPFKSMEDMLAVNPFAAASRSSHAAAGRLHTPSHVTRVAS